MATKLDQMGLVTSPNTESFTASGGTQRDTCGEHYILGKASFVKGAKYSYETIVVVSSVCVVFVHSV